MAVSITAVAMNAAAALDRTHAIGERGPRTLQARELLARWLDGNGKGDLAKVRAAIQWLRSVPLA